MTTIYNAAPLFNAPDQMYNLILTNKLESLGHSVILPQRDGFEFSKLNSALEKILEREQVPNAVNRIIYFLDKGKFIGQDADICIARLDEPSDGGVEDEIGFCNLIGVPVLGFRTDVRSPYGSPDNEVGGAHFFPPYSCKSFIIIPSNFKNPCDISNHIDKLDSQINKYLLTFSPSNEHYNTSFFAAAIIHIAKKLFGEIDDIHSEKGLKEIARRYIQNKNFIESNLPIIKKV